jgi:hypothetical protein
MERVRDLSWGAPFGAIAAEARTGFARILPAGVRVALDAMLDPA